MPDAPDGVVGEWTVPTESAGERLDRFLRNRIPELAKDSAKSAISAGFITVGDHVVRRPSARLEAGQIVKACFDRQALVERPPKIKPQKSRLRVIFADDSVLVLDKPAGIPVLPTGRVRETTLSSLADAWAGSVGRAVKPRPVHRLDQDTSGLVLFAFGRQAREALEAQFESHGVRRVYIALVHGCVKPDEGTLKSYLATDPRTGLQRAVPSPRLGAEALTDFRILTRYRRATLLEARLRTGRTNQIRAQFAQLGHPVVGDRRYSRASDFTLRFRPVALHAAGLRFIHPVTGREMSFESPTPSDFARLLEGLPLPESSIGDTDDQYEKKS
ncbi:MAG TPA: RluA family pseudouridine synthase [Candidatus Brocadiia bacterium]|nr:RluA family pseudouridine synthase [Candidatus Brocadiia bacterium]